MWSIVLIGFMGAGKTTVGRELAAITDRTFCDLDTEIIKIAGMGITQIFEDCGEFYFRDLETSALQSVVGRQGLVVATGGGVVERPGNWPLMRATGRIIYLQASWECLRQRIGCGGGRPLARQQDGWNQVRSLFLRREPLYQQADFVVDTEGKKTGDVAAVIAGLCFEQKENSRG